ncbi:MAG: hypothetical protein U9R06_03980 [Patescibacteria group bacterium]|nr:hypothetical protein [Patescibacteria group bacterium]
MLSEAWNEMRCKKLAANKKEAVRSVIGEVVFCPNCGFRLMLGRYTARRKNGSVITERCICGTTVEVNFIKK